MKNIVIVAVSAVTFGLAIYLVSSQGGFGNAVNSDTSLASENFGYEDVRKLIGSLESKQQQAVLENDKVFARVVNQEALRLSMLDAARQSNFGQNEKIRYRFKRQAEDALITSYINHRLKSAGVPKGFPNKQQIEQYYKNNQKKFSPGERLPVWQIFWPIGKNASKPEAAKLLKKASLVSDELKAGKMTLAQAAARHSQHPFSKDKGGYMGVLETADLRKPIKAKLMALPEKTVSDDPYAFLSEV